MALWNKVQAELDKAGKVARAVVDEGKLRLDAYRGREQADKAAEALGYAVFRAEEAGGTLDPAVREQLMNTLRDRDAEARRLEAQVADLRATASSKPAAPSSSPVP
jgi:hypothetical protein